jgi:hypothetical protein
MAEDIATHKRTLVHIPCDPGVEIKEGDQLIILRRHSESRGIRTEIVETGQVKLVDSLTPLPGATATAALDDMARLNLMPSIDQARIAEFAPAIAAYQNRWDDVNPDVPWASNPMVWRVVFRYLPEMAPPEYATAV